MSAHTVESLMRLTNWVLGKDGEVYKNLESALTELVAERDALQARFNLTWRRWEATRYQLRQLRARITAAEGQEPVAWIKAKDLERLKHLGKTDEGIEVRYANGFPSWIPASVQCQFLPLYLTSGAATPVVQPIGINGLTDAETDASMSVRGLSKPTAPAAPTVQPRKMEIPPAPIGMEDVCYVEGWNACCDAFFGGLPPPEALIITVTEQVAPTVQPLTDEGKRILFECLEDSGSWGDLEYFLEGIERAEIAHGIKEQT